MALFVINRYLGDENDNDVAAKESRSKALLAKLQEQARARQLQNSASLDHQKPELPVNSEALSKKSKKRKRKEEETQVSHKRKAVELSQALHPQTDTTVGLGLEMLNAETVLGESNLSSKKKKRKKGVEMAQPTEQSETVIESSQKVEQKQKTPAAEEKEDLKGQSSENSDKKAVQSGFTVLGGFERKKVKKVQMVLPQWLAQPDVVQRDIKKNLIPIREVSGISPRLLTKLESSGIQHFFPVQAEVIPAILESVHQGLLVGRGGYRPRDVCVSAPTGSGKTLAFVIPIVQALLERVVCEVRALAVLPTKELAQQVWKVFHSYAEGTDLKVVMLTGQKSFAAEQASLVETSGTWSRSLADIVVATPGRLVDHINMTSGFILQNLRFLVIDEADRMIDSMHHSWLSQVVKAVYQASSTSDTLSVFRRIEPGPVTAASLSLPQMPLQKLLFSATLTHDPEKLQQLGLHQPRLFSSTHGHPESTAPQPRECFNFPQGLTEYYVPCTLNKKPLLILHFILRLKFSPILCFTNSRDAAHRLYLLCQLYGGVQVAEFSSRLSPSERKKALKDFEQGKIQLLISTDATARGIDINGVKCVVNYDAPQFIRTYVHRVGRTARAGKAGLAFTFLLGVQEKPFLQMVQDAGSPGVQRHIVKPENLKGMELHYQQTLLELEKAIKEEKAKKHI